MWSRLINETWRAACKGGDDNRQFYFVDGLWDMHLKAGAKRSQAVIGAGIGSKRDGRNSTDTRIRVCPDAPKQLVAVSAGHPDIADQYIERLIAVRLGFERCQRGFG